MSFYSLWETALDLLSRITSFCNMILEFLFYELEFGSLGSIMVIELLFGSALITFLTVKIVAAFVVPS